ncbi:cadherin-like beta sandwich domain-containing protein [Clostridium taeniosporum]|uniref:Cadherin-like beta-sandwich-like domain-containing protein n=1 Tax=Clostridium taeniosporum TaxID=394958 RepID=A0A1D7XMJ5_9CLOT|nr:cadherin-like beta sandwich domain-containing protein [Clostridium taeniosporum]AOR24544.1 hypothetical protein BGI42_12705 [Clostridium taeniosporum]
MGEKINKKRIISLFVALTCMFSLLPVQFGTIKVQAATSLDINGSQYALNVTGTKLEGNTIDTGVKVDSTKTIYNTQGRFKEFQIDLPKYKNEIVEPKKTERDDVKGEITETEQKTIIDRKIDINSINRIGKEDLKDIDVITEQTQTKSISGDIVNGVRIDNIPLGTNEVMYKITEKTTVITTKTVFKVNVDGTTSLISGPTTSQTQEELVSSPTPITIEHAENYAQGKIKKIDFKSYVGSKDNYDNQPDNGGKNKVPFLYDKELLTTDTESFFTYEHIVNDQVQNLQYAINFEESFNLNGAKVWMDGASKGDITSNGNVITGSLQKTDSKIMVIKMPTSSGGSGDDNTLGKNYAIKMKFIDENASNDYTLRKLDIESKYNDITDATNYIEKEFKDVTVPGQSKRYEGKIHLDKNSGKVKITPQFGKESGYVVKLSNHYIDEYGNIRIKQQDFDKFVSFNNSDKENIIYMDVYEGSDNSDELGALLATYELKVVLEGEKSAFDFGFGNTILKDANGGTKEVNFNSSVHKYDLYVTDPSKKVTITYKTGLPESNAVIKVNGISENIPIIGGVAEFDLNKSGGKQLTISVYKDGNLVSDKYIFNVQGDSDDGEGELPSAQNAYLSYLNFSTGDLKNEDGNSGFLRETLNYDLLVKPDTKIVDVTAIVDEPKASITEAKVVETGEIYNLTSGTKGQIPLQASGTTTLQIVVTAENGKDKKKYTVVINHDDRGNNADLKDIELSTGEYEFDSDDDEIKVRVDQDVKKIKVKPIPVDSNYSNIIVDGEKFTGDAISVSLQGQWKTEIDIDVIAEDRSTEKTYTLIIYRSNDSLDDIKDPDYDDDDEEDDDDAYYDESSRIWIDMSKYEEWAKIKGKYIYFDKRGRQVKDAWVKVEGEWFYVNKYGHRTTGWKKESDGRWYYLDRNGRMTIGWFYDKDSRSQYYFNGNGTMHVGWLYMGGNWYYFDSSGKMLQNEKAYIDGDWYSFSTFGIMYK